MSDPSLLHEVTHELTTHPNHLRIRKLVFYICKRHWANDSDTLLAEPLQSLISDLLQQAPTAEQLKKVLETAVKTLNKRAEYILVANVISQTVRRLYSAQTAISNPLTQTSYQLTKIAEVLDQESNAVRIKKLLLYICRNIWENDPAKLQQICLQELLQETLETTTDLEDLKLVLSSVINSLNRRSEYTLVADTIIRNLRPFYEHNYSATQFIVSSSNDSTQIIANSADDFHSTQALRNELSSGSSSDRSLFDDPYQPIAIQLEQDQQNLFRVKKLLFSACNHYWENDPNQLANISLETLLKELHASSLTLTDLQSSLNAIVNTLNHRDVYAFVASEIVQACVGLYPASATNAIAPPPQSRTTNTIIEEPLNPLNFSDSIQFTKRPYNAFDLRLELMKYTNPLRAKILIFSVLHHQFLFNRADWSALKTYELDTLIKDLFDKCETISSLTAQLEIIASCLPEPDEYTQTAGAIFQCLKPFYPTVEREAPFSWTTPQSTASQASEHTSISHFAEATQLNPAPLLTDDDHTCQFLPIDKETQELRSPNSQKQPSQSFSQEIDTELLELPPTPHHSNS